MAPKPDGSAYFKHALFNQYNLIMLAGSVLFSLVDGSPLPLLVGVGAEMAYLATVPGLGVFRRWVDRKYEAAAREEAKRKRGELIAQMAEAHQQRFAQLEALTAQIKTNVARQGDAVRVLLEDSLAKADRLTARYVQLAIAHKSYGEYLRATDRRVLGKEIEGLEAGLEKAPPRVREMQAQRLAIAKKRAERWDRARENIEVLAHQLATIQELICLMHEQSIAPKDPERMSADLDRFMSDLEDNQDSVRELAEFGGDDDAQLAELELGREAANEGSQRAR